MTLTMTLSVPIALPRKKATILSSMQEAPTFESIAHQFTLIV
jgi:hypothetical protein